MVGLQGDGGELLLRIGRKVRLEAFVGHFLAGERHQVERFMGHRIRG